MISGHTNNSMGVNKLAVAGDRNRLNEEFVTALGVRGRILLHGLEEDCVMLVSGPNSAPMYARKYAPETSTFWPGSTRPELGRTQYLSTCKLRRRRKSQGRYRTVS